MESLRWKREIMAEEETKINCHEKRQPSHSSSGKRRGRQFRSSRVKHETRRDLFCSMSILLFVLLAVQKEFNCLRISSIGIPPAILNGSQTTLECNYELGPGDQLYSVTWYKDRVGFYRYQPAAGETQEQTATTTSVEQRGQNLNLNYQSHHQAPIVAPPNAKHEFDWAGISLDLARSNSTHVHLKQVGLNSEGTFECEVIADAPTFATVSASRQMRVYVLPKRKLSMTDNSQQVTSQSSLSLQNQNQDQLQSPSQQQHQLFRQNLYQLNDLLNFTCVSGPSRPAARLSWFLNDLPIAAFIQQTGTIPNRGSHEPSNQNSQNNNQEHRGSIWADNQTTSKSTDSLVETRSTLVLRLQASHLRQLRAKASQQQRQRSVGGAGGSYLPLKLSCVSQLSVEFSSNTSLLISGGKTSTMKRSRNPPADSAGAPEASSWRLEQGGGGTATTLANSRRRPEPQDAPSSGEDDDQEMGSLDSDRMDSHQNSIFRWPPAAASSSTGRQRPKQGPDYDVSSSAAPPGGLETNYHSDGELAPSVSRKPPRNLVVWTNRQLRDQSDHIERLLAKSSANELESAHIEAQTVRAASDMRGRPVPVDEPEQESGWPSSSSPSQQHQHESAKLNNNDYQLYELVNFTCHQEDRGDDGGDGPERMHNVHLKWFLNDRELSGDIINAYEPARGFYFEPSESIQQLSDGNGRATGNWSASGQHAHVQRSSGSDQVGGGELATSRSLLIEFSPNLFRLRELSLRCTTIIEQPLIEFESVQWLYLATSPFIQAHDNHHQQQQNQSPRPSLYNVNSRHRQQHPHRQPGQQQRQSPGNVIKMRHQSSRTSASSSSSLSGSTLAGSSLLTQGGGRLVYLLVTIWFSLMLAFAVPILHLDTTSTMLRRG